LSDLDAVGVEQGEAVEMAILRIYYVDRKDIATEQVIVARAEPLHNLAHDAQERSSPSQHLPRPRTSGDNQPRGRISSRVGFDDHLTLAGLPGDNRFIVLNGRAQADRFARMGLDAVFHIQKTR